MDNDRRDTSPVRTATAPWRLNLFFKLRSCMLVQTRKRLKWQQACGKRQVPVHIDGCLNGAIPAGRTDQNNHDRQTVSVINKYLRLSLRTVCHVPLYSKN